MSINKHRHDSNDVHEKLDHVFNEFVEDMKPYVLNLTSKQDRHIIASWIKKLCHPSNVNTTERKNRNLYAQILVQMLQKGHLQDPFTKKPSQGKLPTIPAYMSTYLDETGSVLDKSKKSFNGPEWLQEDFDDSILYQTLSHESYHKYKDVISPKRREKFMLSQPIFELDSTINISDVEEEHSDFLETSQINELELYLQKNKENLSSTKVYNKSKGILKSKGGKRKTAREEYTEHFEKTEFADNEDKTKHTITMEPKLSQAHVRSEIEQKLPHEKEMELKLRLIEGKVQEETLKIQQQHDQMVKKILDRKNNEMNDLKKYYNSKIEELESSIKMHEKKVQQMSQEVKQIQGLHAQEVNGLKEAMQKTASNTATEYEKMMYDKLNGFEKEMFGLQKTHRQNIQEILVEADEKVKTVKKELRDENEELKFNIIKLTENLESIKISQEKSLYEKERCIKEKDGLKEQIAKLGNELEIENKKTTSLEKENNRLIDEYETVVKDLRKKSNQAFDDMKKERTSAATKTASVISELESRINQYRQTVQDMELTRKRELREQEAIHKQELIQMEMSHEKKIRILQSESGKKELEYQGKIGRYELNLKEKEEEMRKLDTKLQDHTRETETVIERFRKQAEDNSSRVFEDLTSQLNQLKAALNTAKERIEQQKVEFAKRLDERRTTCDKQLSDYTQTAENERLKLHQNYKQERELLIQNYKKEKDDGLSKQQHSWKENEVKLKTISDLEAQIRELREEVIQANSLRKEQLQEVGALREEEKQVARRNEDSLHSKYNSQVEQVQFQLQKEHSVNIADYTEKMDQRLKEIETQYSKKANTDKTTIAALQSQLSGINSQLKNKTDQLEIKLIEMNQRSEEDKKMTEKKIKSTQQKLNEELETQKIKYKQLEKQYQNMELKYEEQISSYRLDFEEKRNGMLPISVQKELEDTIESMRQQIVMLQSRAAILQEELDISTKFTLKRTSSSSLDKENTDKK